MRSVNALKFGEVQPYGFWVMRTDKQTNKQPYSSQYFAPRSMYHLTLKCCTYKSLLLGHIASSAANGARCGRLLQMLQHKDINLRLNSLKLN